MSALHPGLRLLAKRKLRGALRKQKRRLKTPSGLVFGGIGVLLLGLYVVSLIAGQVVRPPVVDPGVQRGMVTMGAVVLTVLTLTNALSHRGLYLPQDEIQRLFSSPVSRHDIVRYRLVVSMVKSSFGGMFISLIVMGRMPLPPLAFLGAFMAVLMLPVVGQATSLLAGALERRYIERIPKSLFGVLNVAAVVLLVLVTFGFMMGSERAGKVSTILPMESFEALTNHPALSAVSLPLRPWIAMVTAETVPSFLFWFALCTLLLVACFELTARLPVDYRELSLQTSADVAHRIKRMRRGGGAAASRVSRRTVGVRIPWVWGRSPFGAVAWRKTVGVLRKARGTILVSASILIVLTIVLTNVGPADPDEAMAFELASLAVFGIVYVGAGLRFDFRDDLDHMESIKAWPLSPSRAFLATILPQAMLVSLLILVAVAVRTVLSGQFDPRVLVAVPGVPLFALVWTAVDNAVYLFAPVRYVPGQDGALQNMGRTIVLMFVRLGVLLFILTTVGAVAAAPYLLQLEGVAGMVLAVLGASVLMGVEVGALIFLGGRLFRRFDVARDRG